MQKALFSSIDGRYAHQDAIIAEFNRAAGIAATQAVELQVMCFAFTQAEIADALIHALTRAANLRVRIIADWSQGAPNSPSAVARINAAAPNQVDVRYKIDLPYVAAEETGHSKWNYNASHGMLHHKTLCVIVDGTPQKLVFGSYNWSGRGAQAYENTLFIDAEPTTRGLVTSFVEEFECLWADETVTTSPTGISEIAGKAKAAIADGGALDDVELLQAILPNQAVTRKKGNEFLLENGAIVPAFSGRFLTESTPHYGFSAKNASRKLNLLRPSGKRKLAPVTLNSIALEAIRSVPKGAPLMVAMYALSPRVPEYGAILDAARRGCDVRLLLDGKIGNPLAAAMERAIADENLPLQIRTTNRRMHQKYIVVPSLNMVVTGTANMTQDSAERHAEHRVLFRNAPQLAASFTADFDMIWSRLDRNYSTPKDRTGELSAA